MPYTLIAQKHKIFYQTIAGQPDRPHLVFLHEGLGCAAMWGNFPELLCRETGCPGLVYDRLGYGMSSISTVPRTIHYLHRSALYELPTVLNQIIPKTSHILIGHSDGGTIALLYAAERPSGLLGVITEAAHINVDSQTIAGIRTAEEAWQQGKLQGLTQYHGDNTENVFRAWSETWLSKWFRSWNVEYLLPSITSPLLVIQGESDHYGSQDQAMTISSKSSGEARTEIVEACAHIPHQEAKSKVLALMSEFIATLIREEDLTKER